MDRISSNFVYALILTRGVNLFSVYGARWNLWRTDGLTVIIVHTCGSCNVITSECIDKKQNVFERLNCSNITYILGIVYKHCRVCDI